MPRNARAFCGTAIAANRSGGTAATLMPMHERDLPEGSRNPQE